ncbi:MAG: NfeD family protein [Alistipes sp.]|nr:NfeD family protein [Alistipes sp.]MBO7307147.1 NfeD family protein [Alistipes sp.]
MEIWHLWTIAALLLFIVELFTAGFAVICLSLGAAGAAIAAACDLDIYGQLIAFTIVSLVALALVRPLLKRFFYRGGEKVATNVNAMVGRKAKVVMAIDGDEGRVMIDGVDWKARSADGERVEVGTMVEIVAVDSVVLTVKTL